jgi:hypothetical protein
MKTYNVSHYKIESFEDKGKLLVKVYNLNAKKEWNMQIAFYSFRDEQRREEYINEVIENYKAQEKRKQDRKDSLKNYTADIESGSIYYDSWGYDMTLNDYLKVLSSNGKTAKCVMIGARVEDDCGRGNGRSYPVPSVIKSKPFNLRIREGYEGQPYLVGSYPFCGDDSKRRGSFSKNTGQGDYYNTWD